MKYYEVRGFSGGLARVREDKIGYINKKGEEVVKVGKYDYVGDFREGLAWVRIGDGETGKYGYINKKGQEVIKLKYDAVNSFSEGTAPVREGDNWYIIDKKGKVIRKI